jgi:hypothetical protein
METIQTTKGNNYKNVEYNGKQYIVGYTPFKNDHILFVFDADDKDKVVKHRWYYRTDGGYIGGAFHFDNDIIKVWSLHNVVMNKLTHDGKGQQHTVDHINRIGRDNRKENLRILTQSAQNFNQKKRDRKIKLPEDCNITADMIPKNVWYVKARGGHGDGFCIEIKGVSTLGNGSYSWNSTRSTNVALDIKLQESILKLKKLKDECPELQQIDDMTNEIRLRELSESFNAILQKSGYPQPVIEANLVKVDYTPITAPVITPDVEKVVAIHAAGKKKESKLPPDCGITLDMIPKYCYYTPATNKRGDKFVIDRRPGLKKENANQIQWETTSSKNVSTRVKFEQLMERYNSLKF